jgi:methionyl aminopeptidase
MSIQTPQDLEKLRIIGKIVADCLRHLKSLAQPGMSAFELDQMAGKFLHAHGARSAPKLTYQFPGFTCISVANEVAHGIPTKRKILREGDLVNIDVSAEKDGYFADTGGSFVLGKNAELEKLCAATERALAAALKEAKAGAKIHRIGWAIENEANKSGYSVIRNIGSHGVGRALHEAPEFIAGYFDAKDTRTLTENLVITIEPFLSTGAEWVEDSGDGWTLKTSPRFRSAQFEHSLVITKNEPVILTA